MAEQHEVKEIKQYVEPSHMRSVKDVENMTYIRCMKQEFITLKFTFLAPAQSVHCHCGYELWVDRGCP